MKKTKVLLVGPVPPPLGGIPIYVDNLLNSTLLNQNCNLQLFNTTIPTTVRRFEKRNERSYSSFLSDGVVPGIKLFFHVFYTFFSYTKSLILENPSIVQVFTSSFWGFWRSCTYILIAKLLNRNVIFHLLNAIDIFWKESSGFSRFLMRYVMNRCDVLLVQSQVIKKFVESISSTKVIAIYNGVETGKFKNEISKKNYSNMKVQVVFVGGLSKNKGVFDIIQAARLIQNNQVHFLFVGKGDTGEFKEHARFKSVDGKVKFTGEISEDEKIKLLSESDIFVLPSYAEGQPVAILEAMSAGLPIISSSVGSIPEIVRDGENGFLIEPGDIKNLAGKIKLLAKNLEIRKSISINNYKIARERYDIQRVFTEIDMVYRDLIQSS